MEAVVSYAKTVLFFLLFSNLVMQLLKGSNYERFIHPVCGMILLILILRPILELFGGEEKVLHAAEQKISFLLAQEMPRLVVPEDAGYEFAVLEAYEEELLTQLSGILSEEGLFVISADFSLSAEEKSFGTLRGLTVFAEYGKKETGTNIEIEPIVFEHKRPDTTVSAEEIRIKDKLANFYRIGKENINVNIKEERDG